MPFPLRLRLQGPRIWPMWLASSVSLLESYLYRPGFTVPFTLAFMTYQIALTNQSLILTNYPKGY